MDTVKINKGNVKMIAHRGVSGIETENTNAAFVAAGNRSYFGVETDVHRTSDGKYVVIHDSETARVAGVEYIVEECTYEELSKIILFDRDGTKDRSDLRIPLLSEYLKICKKYDKVCVIELKGAFTDKENEEIVQIVKQAGMYEKTIFISFVIGNLISIRKNHKDIPMQLLGHGEITEDLIKELKQNKLDIDYYYESFTKENVELLHKNGIKVNCYTCDDAKVADKLVKMGVDFITTNILE